MNSKRCQSYFFVNQQVYIRGQQSFFRRIPLPQHAKLSSWKHLFSYFSFYRLLLELNVAKSWRSTLWPFHMHLMKNGGALIYIYFYTVFENHRKSLIQHCERSDLRLHWSILASFWKPTACGQTVLPDRSILISQKLVENAKIQKFKCDILGDFQTML